MQLTIVEISKPAQPAGVSSEEAQKIRRQAEKVLTKHRGDLPREVVTMLASPRLTIITMGLREAADWLAEHNSLLKEEYCRNHVYYGEVHGMLNRLEKLLAGEFGEVIKAKLSSRNRQLLEMDMFQILRGNRVQQLKGAAKQAEQILPAENKDAPRPTPPRREPRRDTSRTSGTQGPKLREIIVDDGTNKRERAPKEPKPVYTGLPPVRTDDTDTSFVDAKPYAVQGAPNPQGPDAEERRRNQTIHVEGNKGKRVKGGGAKTRPGRRN